MAHFGSDFNPSDLNGYDGQYGDLMQLSSQAGSDAEDAANQQTLQVRTCWRRHLRQPEQAAVSTRAVGEAGDTTSEDESDDMEEV